MIVATATDSAYAELTGVMLASLAANAHGDFDKVYVFGDRLTPQDKDRLRASYGLDNIAFVDLTAEDMQAFAGLAVRHHLSRTAYARLLMPSKVDPAARRLLYIDCDTVVNRPLAPLSGMSLEGYVLAAVDDDACRRPERHRERNRAIGLPEDMRYFNSGVLLIDLDQWRERGIMDRIRAFGVAHPEISMMDQDLLNGTLKGEWLALDETWNLHRRYSSAGRDLPPGAWRQAHIIHFIGQVKPNHAESTHPATEVFLEHRQRSAWANESLTGPFRRKLAKRLRKLRRFFSGVAGGLQMGRRPVTR